MSPRVTVLCVDDEPELASLTASILEREAGMGVETAHNAREGLDLLDAHEFDCVVSDFDVTEQEGVNFLASVRDQYPGLPYILFSAKGRDRIEDAGITEAITKFIQKGGTETYEQLAAEVSAVVDAPADETASSVAVDPVGSLGRISDPVIAVDGEFTITYVNEGGATLLDGDVSALHGEFLWDHYPTDGESNVYMDAHRSLALDQEQTIAEYVDHQQTEYRVDLYPSDDGLTLLFRDRSEAPETDAAHPDQHASTPEMSDTISRDMRVLIENAPISFMEADMSAVKEYVEGIDAEVEDLRAYFDENTATVGQEIMKRFAVTTVNENAVQYYGADSKEDLKNNVEQIVVDESWERIKELYLGMPDGKQRFETECLAQSFDGKRRYENLYIYTPDAYVDDFSRVFITVTDRYEQKQYEMELERKNEQLEEFSRVVSHDLRNPLTVAQGWVDSLREDCDGYDEQFDAIERAHDRMDTLIDDLLLLAQSGTPLNDTEFLDLATVATESWSTVETREATLQIDADRTVNADPNRLQQLLENLFRNSVEHGPSNVTVTVGSFDTGFYIADDGPGIDDDKKDTVLEGGYSSQPDGTGFGLTIVTEIVDAHGWDLTVTDSADGGARFEIDVEDDH